MKIYFSGSIRGGRELQENYAQIIEYLKEFGNVLTEHIGNKELSNQGEKLSSQQIFERDINWVKESNTIIADVTIPSLGVGYEIRLAEELKKPILCIYQKKTNLSAMIKGNTRIKVKEYKDLKEAKKIIKEFFEEKK